MIGEYLYTLAGRDLQDPGLEVLHFRTGKTENNILLELDTLVPLTHILLLMNLYAEFQPDPGKSIVSAYFSLVTPTKNQVIPLASVTSGSVADSAGIRNALAVTASKTISLDRRWEGLPIMGGWFVRATGQYSLGGANNAIDMTISGILIPRGNVIAA